MTPEYWSSFPHLANGLSCHVSMLETADHNRLHVYEMQQATTADVVLISPAESPFLLMSPLFNVLSREFHTVAWDDPTSPFMSCDDALPSPTLERMADDLIAIVEAKSLNKPHIVTWCAGALTAIWALATRRLSVSSLSLIAPPSVLSRSRVRTGFQSSFLQMVLELASAKSADEAALCKKIQAVPKARPVTSDVERAILDLTGLPLRNDVATKRYARLVRDVCTSVPPGATSSGMDAYAALLSQLCEHVPVAFLHCKDDDIVSYQCSVDASVSNQNTKLILYAAGGHFVIYDQPEVIGADLSAFVRAAETKGWSGSVAGTDRRRGARHVDTAHESSELCNAL